MKPERIFVLKLGAVLTAGLLLTACAAGTSGVSGGGLVGVYRLVSVDDKPLPAGVDHGGTTLWVRSGSFTFHADGTCGTRTTFVPPSGTEIVREVRADYTRDGSRLRMRWHGAGTTSGSIQGDTFTLNNGGMTFVYRR
jgi:hypothetical protein